jgi:hypothetical protein
MFSGNGCGGFESALIIKGSPSVSLKSASDRIGFHLVDMEMLMGTWDTRYQKELRSLRETTSGSKTETRSAIKSGNDAEFSEQGLGKSFCDENAATKKGMDLVLSNDDGYQVLHISRQRRIGQSERIAI